MPIVGKKDATGVLDSPSAPQAFDVLVSIPGLPQHFIRVLAEIGRRVKAGVVHSGKAHGKPDHRDPTEPGMLGGDHETVLQELRLAVDLVHREHRRRGNIVGMKIVQPFAPRPGPEDLAQGVEEEPSIGISACRGDKFRRLNHGLDFQRLACGLPDLVPSDQYREVETVLTRKRSQYGPGDVLEGDLEPLGFGDLASLDRYARAKKGDVYLPSTARGSPVVEG